MVVMSSRTVRDLSPMSLLLLFFLVSISFVPAVEAVSPDSTGLRMLEEIQTVITELAE